MQGYIPPVCTGQWVRSLCIVGGGDFLLEEKKVMGAIVLPEIAWVHSGENDGWSRKKLLVPALQKTEPLVSTQKAIQIRGPNSEPEKDSTVIDLCLKKTVTPCDRCMKAPEM